MNCVWLGYDTEGHEAGEGAVGAAGGWTIHRHGQMTLSMSGRSSEGKSRLALRGTFPTMPSIWHGKFKFCPCSCSTQGLATDFQGLPGAQCGPRSSSFS